MKANAILVAIETKPEECGVYSSLPNITPERVTTVKPCAYQARFRRRPSSCLMGNSTVSIIIGLLVSLNAVSLKF